MNILLVEDEERLARSIEGELRADGHRVQLARSIAAAEAAMASRPDLVLLDWALPDGQGVTLLRTWRAQGVKIPIIMLTARADVADKVLALEIGANDYITKPFEPRELLARIHVQERAQTSAAEASTVVERAGVALDVRSRKVTHRGAEVELSRMEFELLRLFLEKPGQVFTRQELLHMVWGYEGSAVTRTVDFHVSQLRQKLAPELFETVRRVGYRFIVAMLAFLFCGAGPVPPALTAAHAGYVAKDFAAVADGVEQVLTAGPVDDVVADNALRLMERAFAFRTDASHEKVAALPAGISYLEVRHRRVENVGSVTHQLEIQGDGPDLAAISQLRLEQIGGEVVLDKVAGRGRWLGFPEKLPDIAERRHNFYLQSAARPVAFPAGFYQLTLALKDGSGYVARFPLTTQAASAAPEVVTPVANAVVDLQNPVVSWRPFRSPEMQAFERSVCVLRVIRLATGKEGDGERLGAFWGAERAFDAPTTMTVGERYGETGGYGETGLLSGRYVVEVGYSESRAYSAMSLVRESVRRVPFSVAAP